MLFVSERTRKNRGGGGARRNALAAAFCGIILALIGVTFAYAAPQARAVDDPENLVDTVSPSGTTINVFDYNRGDYDRNGDTENPGDEVRNWSEAGINANHTLKFGGNMKGELTENGSIDTPNNGLSQKLANLGTRQLGRCEPRRR